MITNSIAFAYVCVSTVSTKDPVHVIQTRAKRTVQICTDTQCIEISQHARQCSLVLKRNTGTVLLFLYILVGPNMA